MGSRHLNQMLGYCPEPQVPTHTDAPVNSKYGTHMTVKAPNVSNASKEVQEKLIVLASYMKKKYGATCDIDTKNNAIYITSLDGRLHISNVMKYVRNHLHQSSEQV
ncbi:uncharacterized protein [Physcomitrium patens]|uniref:Uncharacterized protein n=1 Tax=Physcomitrium patens TaxID=3218 RepID=A0A2K1L7L3_PHYPA|nr:uncharacterized protein LOC112279890 [Physcomitrium patens]PNR61984.1 hypothetical protein PHYPA_000408 [Physcomitrium patens]|eukprot:XP_024370431.1 uncharacterized protein LOC112279890 [Physcomitrella patens]